MIENDFFLILEYQFQYVKFLAGLGGMISMILCFLPLVLQYPALIKLIFKRTMFFFIKATEFCPLDLQEIPLFT
jgi:hypothetical protein